MRIILGLVLLFAPTSAAIAQTVLDNSLPSKYSIADINTVISKDFRDPRSSQFKEIKVIDAWQGGVVVCGWVNSKNAYGGYSEFYPFYWVSRNGTGLAGTGYGDPILHDLTLLALQGAECAGPLGLK